MGYRRFYHRRQYRTFTSTRYAGRQVSASEQFEREMGGTLEDVRQYFFSLSGSELERVLFDYRLRYGASAEAHARRTLPKWESGATKMSGLVAKRLFDFLPPRMSLEKKLELASNLWRKYASRSTHAFTVGPYADLNLLMCAVQNKLDITIQDHIIPSNIRARFEWLSGGDVIIKEHLLNHFRQMEKRVSTEYLSQQVPILQTQMRLGGAAVSARTRIDIQRHVVDVFIDPRLGTQFREGEPESQRTAIKDRTAGVVNAVVIIFVLILTLLLLTSHH